MDAWLTRAKQEIQQATAGMKDEQWRQSPSGKWTPAQILEHLRLTFTGTTKLLQKTQAGGAAVPSPTLGQRFGTALVLGFQWIPSGRQAPNGTQPSAEVGSEALPNILSALDSMDVAIGDAARHISATGVVAVHPVLGPLTAAQWAKFHYTHTHHHMKQVRALRT